LKSESFAYVSFDAEAMRLGIFIGWLIVRSPEPVVVTNH
jgi:hypothetical protein